MGKVGLRPVRRQELGIKVFEDKEAATEIRDVVEISLGALNDKKSVKIEAFVVKDISTIPNVHVERVKKNFLHLTNVCFQMFLGRMTCFKWIVLLALIGSGLPKKGRQYEGGQKSQ